MTWITKYMMNTYQGWDTKPKNIMFKHLQAYVIQNWSWPSLSTCLQVFNVFAKVNHCIQNNMAVIQDCSTHYCIFNPLMHRPAMPLQHAMHIVKLVLSPSSKQLYTTQQHIYWQNLMVTSHTSWVTIVIMKVYLECN